MVRTQIQITEEQARTLRALALEKEVSIAELIRRSIDLYVRSAHQPTPDEQRERALAIVGKYSSGASDLSTEHDHYLAEIYGEGRE